MSPSRLMAAAAAVVCIASSVKAATPALPQDIYLSGHGNSDAVPWDFFCTGGRRSGVWTTIHVPSCWEQEGFGRYEYGVEVRPSKHGQPPPPLADEQGLYRTHFTLPDFGGGHVIIVFEGVMTDATVKINGQLAGPTHQGAFYRFRYDITSLVHPGGRDNLLEVTVAKKSANRSVNDAERWGDFWNFGGIFRPVHLELRPATYADDIATDARADGSFTAVVDVQGAAAANCRVSARLRLPDGTTAPLGEATADRSGRAALHGQGSKVQLWTAETPHLYTVEFTLSPAQGDPSSVSRRVGFRTFEVRPRDGLYLNGHRIVLKGVNRHSFWPESGRTLSRDICFNDARLIKAANMNAVRMSHYPPDTEFLDACDEVGLYVLDELTGWHGKYDTPTGTKLVEEMVRRDVNHPSILFWDNGNEGGFNFDLDNQYARWDPQHRVVLHPWADFDGVNTAHYRTYPQTQEMVAGPDIFMPTEFQHGLYDGGIGSGMDDYWELMRHSRVIGGGFFWAWLDEAVARTDQHGRLDSRWNLGPDGMVGPHREPEGSYYTVQQIWSPVQASPARDASGPAVRLENRFDFTSLESCSFHWALAKFYPADRPGANGHAVLASGDLRGPAVAAGAAGLVRLPLDPHTLAFADAVYFTALAPGGRALWTWSWPTAVFIGNPAPGLAPDTRPATAVADPGWGVRVQEQERGYHIIRSGELILRFDNQDGHLAVVERDGRPFSLTGPRMAAYRRDGRKFIDVSHPAAMTSSRAYMENGRANFEARYADSTGDGASLRRVHWSIGQDETVQFDYDYRAAGVIDLLGLDFGYPADQMRGKRWLGRGPYHQWQNRIKGTTLDIWSTPYNNLVHGEEWTYPEFQGFFTGCRWADFDTTEGHILWEGLDADHDILNVYTAPDGRDDPVLQLPALGLGVYRAFPAMGNKNYTPDLLGPHSQSPHFSGEQRGALTVRFMDP